METTTKKTSKSPAGKTKKTSAKAKTAPAKKGTVKAKPDAASGLKELFEHGMKDIYWAEKALTKALPKMAKNATSSQLIEALNNHLAETQEQVKRLEKAFELLGKKAVGKKCDAMDGLIKEGEGIMEETEMGVVRDAGIIAASQKIEHYEIATYGTLRQYAKTLDLPEVAELFDQTLGEEKIADVNLSVIAMSCVNLEAEKLD